MIDTRKYDVVNIRRYIATERRKKEVYIQLYTPKKIKQTSVALLAS